MLILQKSILGYKNSLSPSLAKYSVVSNVGSWASVPSAAVVYVVPSQAAACDTTGAKKRNEPVLSPFSYVSLLNLVTYSGSFCGVDYLMYQFTLSLLMASTERSQTLQPV